MKIAFDDKWITLKGKKKKNGEDGKGGARIKLDDSGKIIAGLNGKFHGKTIAEMKASAKNKQVFKQSIAERIKENKTSEQIKTERQEREHKKMLNDYKNIKPEHVINYLKDYKIDANIDDDLKAKRGAVNININNNSKTNIDEKLYNLSNNDNFPFTIENNGFNRYYVKKKSFEHYKNNIISRQNTVKKHTDAVKNSNSKNETTANTQEESAVKFNQDGYNKAVEKIKASNKKLYDRAIANADKKYNKPIETAKKALDAINTEIKEKGVNVGSLKKVENLERKDFGDNLKGRLNKARFDLYMAEQNKQASYARAEKKYQLDNDNLVVDGCHSFPSVENKTANNAPSNIGHVVKESAKAVMVEVEIDSPYKDHLVVKGVWIPKNILDENGNAPDWYLEKRLKEIDNLHGRDNLDLPLFGYNSWYYGSKNYKNKNTQANKYSNIEVKEKKEKPKWFAEIENAEKEKSNNAQFNGKFYNNSKDEQGTYKIYVNGNSYVVNEKQKQEYEDYKANNKAYYEQAKKDATYLKIPYAERNVAKMAGAKWDAERKQWYMEKDLTIPEHLKSYIAQDKRVFMAQDKSARSYDKDGRMHVLKTNISKATVNPYYGYEIPNYEKLGLEPKRIYHLLRHPDELKKAVDTFKNLPLLDEHIPVNAKEPEKEHIVGSTGSDVEFKDGFLQCSLSIWDEQAIAGIESGEQKELSSAYYYDVDMTKGEYQGERYDGIMRNIVGNHVALVDTGRAGRDVVVADKDPFKTSKGKEKMSKAKLLLKKLLAQDEDITPEKLLDVVGVLVKNGEKETFKSSDIVEDEDEEIEDVEEVEKKRAEDEEVEEIGNPNGEDEDLDENEPAEDEDEDCAKDEDEDEKRTFTYEDVKKAIEKAVLAERKRNKDAEIAKKDVENIVGDVAMDSAKDIYKFALKQAGVDISGVHPSAYRAMVKMLNGAKVSNKMASDKASNLLAKYPQLKNIRKG